MRPFFAYGKAGVFFIVAIGADMPYIDKQYAEELLKKSQTCINDELLYTVGGTDQGVTKPQTRFCDMSSLDVDDAGQEACTARKSHGACFGLLDQNGLHSKSRSQLRLQKTSLSLEPIVVKRTEDETRAFEKITRLACSRERGSRELIDRLVRDGFSREVAESAVQRALDCGLIDDTRYGAVLIRTRVAQGRGRKGIEDELERAGIAASDIPGWPEEFFSVDDFDPFRVNANAEDDVVVCSFGSESSDEQEIERALALLRRKPPRSKNVQASAYRKLVTKGYSTSVASAATRRFMEEN